MGQQLLDQYSLLHIAIGVVFYFWNVPLFWSIMLHIAFEILENTDTGMSLINKVGVWPGGKTRSDSALNSFGDTLSFAAGWIGAFQLDAAGTKYGWYEPHLTRREGEAV